MARRILGVSLALVWLCAPAHAEEQADDARSGIYMGLGATYGIDMTAEDEMERELRSLGYTSTDLTVNGSPGANARVGYRFHPHLAAELQLDYLAMFVTEDSSIDLTKHQILVITANAKVPLRTGRVEPFLLAGGGLVWAKIEDEEGLDQGPSLAESSAGFGIRAGAGMDVHVSEHISFTVDCSYVLPFGAVADLDFISLGLGVQYRF